jgi:hypothetical protein
LRLLLGLCWSALQGAHRLLLKTTNIKMGVRLGLLNQDHSKALIFEVDSAKMKGEQQGVGPCGGKHIRQSGRHSSVHRGRVVLN